MLRLHLSVLSILMSGNGDRAVAMHRLGTVHSVFSRSCFSAVGSAV